MSVRQSFELAGRECKVLDFSLPCFKGIVGIGVEAILL